MKRMVSCEEIFENEKKSRSSHTHTHNGVDPIYGRPQNGLPFQLRVRVCVYLYFSLPLITLSFALFFLYDFMQATVLCMCPCT